MRSKRHEVTKNSCRINQDMSNYPSKYSHMMRNLVWMHPARQTYLQSNQRQYQGSNKRPVIFHLCHHYMKARALKTFTVHQQQSTFTLAFPDSNKRIRLNDTQGKWVDTKAVHLPVLPGISDSLQILIKANSLTSVLTRIQDPFFGA